MRIINWIKRKGNAFKQWKQQRAEKKQQEALKKQGLHPDQILGRARIAEGARKTAKTQQTNPLDARIHELIKKQRETGVQPPELEGLLRKRQEIIDEQSKR
jgi:hypothetical protein